jgi:hypothetical protein
MARFGLSLAIVGHLLDFGLPVPSIWQLLYQHSQLSPLLLKLSDTFLYEIRHFSVKFLELYDKF